MPNELKTESVGGVAGSEWLNGKRWSEMDGWVGRAAAALVWWVVSRMDGMKDFIKVEHRLICCKITRSNLNTLSRFFLNTKRTTENRCGSKTVCARTPLHANLNKHIRDFRKQQQFQRLLLSMLSVCSWKKPSQHGGQKSSRSRRRRACLQPISSTDVPTDPPSMEGSQRGDV